MALDDFSALRGMVYSGRAITIGMTSQGNPFVGYTLTARDEQNQRRILGYNRDSVKVKSLPGEKEDNPLHFYPAIVFVKDKIVASNGAQTELLIQRSKHLSYPPYAVLETAMDNPFIKNFDGQEFDITSYEPDSPNFTPRISACLDRNSGAFHIVRRTELSNGREVNQFSFQLIPGRTKTITTYQGGNESPLVSFKRGLLEGRVSSSSVGEITDSLFDSINHVNPQDGRNYAIASAVVMKGVNGFDFSVKNRF
ncbi:hypothetical protein HY448_02275 [Candidatus Pacearchaeota archaeon]|nr:hypothetical protein [Candidatus Pacearchaeota archaeon]